MVLAEFRLEELSMTQELVKRIAAALRRVDQRCRAEGQCEVVPYDHEDELAKAILNELELLGLVQPQNDRRGRPTWIATGELIRLAGKEPE
jgi:hypothetical protein